MWKGEISTAMKTQTKNGKQYYLHQDAGGKRIWKPVVTTSDLSIDDIQDSSSRTTVQATVANVKFHPCRVTSSVTGMGNSVQHTYSVNGNGEIELDLNIQWSSRRPSELIRVFVNQGTVHQQSFQIEIDDQGNGDVLVGSAKVTSS